MALVLWLTIMLMCIWRQGSICSMHVYAWKSKLMIRRWHQLLDCRTDLGTLFQGKMITSTTPSRNYFFIAANLELISDDSINEYLGYRRMSRPSFRERVEHLFEGGHYDPKTITCRNVEIKCDGTPCIMFSCKCMSSKSSVMHAITAIFEDTSVQLQL